MKQFVAAVLTIALMGLLLWKSVRRPEGLGPVQAGAPAAVEPFAGAEAQIRELMASARRGDVSAYLAAFGDPMRQALEREVAERGREAFADDLRRTAQARKSHAVFAPEPEGSDAVRITVESVYADRNERQTYHLGQGPSGWLVAGVETARSLTPIARYGTPAEYQEPEAAPVAGAAPVATTNTPPPNANSP
jgi:hypothetical protein